MSESDPVSSFLGLAVLRYTEEDGPARWEQARQLLERHPDLGSRSIHVAAALAEPGLIVQHLAAVGGSDAGTVGGPLGWSPLHYLAYARVRPDQSPEDAEQSVMILLEHGADPNAVLSADDDPPFTVLTGVFGSGEQGSTNQPAHPHALRIATRLLEGGADPNDGQTLYNRMFGAADDHLELLFRFGLGAGSEKARSLVRSQLIWATTHAMGSRLTLLAEHGVDLSSPLDQLSWPGSTPLTPVQLARRAGRPEIARLLVDLGAVDGPEVPEIALVEALLTTDRPRMTDLVSDDPELLDRVRARYPSLVLRAATLDRLEAIRLLVSSGWDVDALGRQDLPIEQRWETALHHAAGEGKTEMTRLLLSLGASTTVSDHRFRATPLGWAQNFGRSETVALLEPVSPS